MNFSFRKFLNLGAQCLCFPCRTCSTLCEIGYKNGFTMLTCYKRINFILIKNIKKITTTILLVRKVYNIFLIPKCSTLLRKCVIKTVGVFTYLYFSDRYKVHKNIAKFSSLSRLSNMSKFVDPSK